MLCALAGHAAWAERVEKSGERLYYVHAPEGLAEDAKPGLLVWPHPASGNAQPEFDWWVQMGGPASKFILLCPQARERSWKPNDRRFVEDSIDEVIERFDVDRERVFLGGHSSGGSSPSTWA